MRVYDESEMSRIIDDAKQKFGDDYSKINWFQDEEAIKATMERNALLAQIEPGLAKDGDDANGTKPHIGPLSPGCQICQHGGWDCSWIDFRCTRNCYFCNSAEDTRTCKDRPPHCLEGLFLDHEDHVLYFKLFQKKGIGISGGEPLLRVDLVLDHLEAIRRECDAPYSWLYTNGDLATPAVLQKLADAGLHEIRFDIAAADYDLERVALAKRFIPTVTVEIPCLPNDYDKVASLLSKMADIGVNHLNLHQLMVGSNNYKPFMAHNFHFLRNVWHTPIHESEITGLKLLKYALDHRINLPINYCSKVYKEFFQERNKRICHAKLKMSAFESTTENGFVRRISVKDCPSNIQSQVDKLKSFSIDPGLWSVIPPYDTLVVHPDILPNLDLENAQMKIEYYYPTAKKKSFAGLFEPNNLDFELIPIFKSSWFCSNLFRAWEATFTGERNFQLESELEEGSPFRSMLRRERMISGFPDVF